VSHVKLGGIVEITLSDLRKVRGRVHSADIQTDLAILQIDDPNINLQQLPVAKFGKSSNLRAGEFVVAVGSPLQLRESVSFGIISAPARHCSEIGMVKCGYPLLFRLLSSSLLSHLLFLLPSPPSLCSPL
jgi:S1-C subfamily serine protease